MFGLPVLALCAALGLPGAVHLRFELDGGLPASSLRRATEETRQIWNTAGITVTAGRPDEPVPAGARVVVVRIESNGQQRTSDHTVLGWITLDEHNVPSPIRVSLPGLLDTISGVDFYGRPVRDLTPRLLEQVTAQAVGRVIAHELGHYLTRSASHTLTGLMRPRYSGAMLVEPSLAPFRIAWARVIARRRPATARATASPTAGR